MLSGIGIIMWNIPPIKLNMKNFLQIAINLT